MIPVGCSIADKFGFEWDLVLGKSHRTAPKSALRTALLHFVTLIVIVCIVDRHVGHRHANRILTSFFMQRVLSTRLK